MAALLSVALASAAEARKPRPEPAPIGEAARPAISPDATQSVCTLGITGPSSFSTDYLLPPDDAYYLRLRPTRCAGCPDSAGVWVSSITMSLDFPVPCTMPVEIALVRTRGDTACAPPDPANLVCGPVATQMVAANSGIQSFTLSLGQACPITREVFARVLFPAEGLDCSGAGQRPRLVTTAACTLCVAYNYYPTDSADFCELQLPGMPLISAAADSCIPAALLSVSESRGNWASLRIVPNPSHGDAAIELSMARGGEVRIEVCDLAGRRVRRIFTGPLEAGRARFDWDARRDSGERVRPGVYLVRILGDGGVSARSVIVLR